MTTTSHLTQHALLDAARMGMYITQARSLTQQHISLYKGDSEKGLADFAPYIFSLTNEDDFATWLLETGWGNSWGVFLQTTASGRALVRHFRHFLMITLDTGEEAYFRFYDPRVLRVFLPTCDPAQLIEFFGPVQSFFMEDEDPAFGLQFWLEHGKLQTSRVVKVNIKQLIL